MDKPITHPISWAERLDRVSVLIPVMNETLSLQQTITTTESLSADDILEYILLVCDRTTADSMAICQAYCQQQPTRFTLLHQTRPFVGGAFQDAFEVIQGTHVIMMASDLETDPRDVPHMIAMARSYPNAIITASRWIKKGSFQGYQPVKWVCNYLFQSFFRWLYRTHLTDMTFGYRLFPRALVQAIEWKEWRHPFFLETIVKPLRLGVAVREVASQWVPRIEGVSQNPFFRNFLYFKVGILTRFSSPGQILKQSHHHLLVSTFTQRGK
ncbi:glycosyltransferase family 2 protein [bacterium]|nr:glycosyltransferase family 2 protein [bacterium]